MKITRTTFVWSIAVFCYSLLYVTLYSAVVNTVFTILIHGDNLNLPYRGVEVVLPGLGGSWGDTV